MIWNILIWWIFLNCFYMWMQYFMNIYFTERGSVRSISQRGEVFDWGLHSACEGEGWLILINLIGCTYKYKGGCIPKTLMPFTLPKKVTNKSNFFHLQKQKHKPISKLTNQKKVTNSYWHENIVFTRLMNYRTTNTHTHTKRVTIFSNFL